MKRFAARPFPFYDVTPLPGTDLYQKTIINANHLLSLDCDRLLYTFRVNAGLSTKGAEPYGGWESPDRWFRGQYIGHYLSACAKSARTLFSLNQTLANQLKERTITMVAGLRECQEALTKTEDHPGYLAAVPSTQLDDLENFHFIGVYTVTYYNIHKTMAGLLDCYLLLGNPVALTAIMAMADYFTWRLSRLSEKQLDQMINTIWYREDETFHMEFGGMSEVLYRLFACTQNPAHLALAQKFDRKWFREMLEDNRDLLGHYALHANTEIPCVHGIAEYADLFDDEPSRQSVKNFMDWMRTGHQSAIGGVSGRAPYPAPADYGGELFDFPGMFFKHLNKKSNESCCSHNLNVLTRRLFQWTTDPIWAEEHERRMVNAVLAQQEPTHGGFVYNLNVAQGSHKNHSHEHFFCCNGSGVEHYSSLTEGNFYESEHCLWVTGFLPAKLDWKREKVTVITTGSYPMDGNVQISFSMAGTKTFSVKLRIPAWAKGAAVSVNETAYPAIPGQFTEISRHWTEGDRICLSLPFSLSVQTMPDRPEYSAVGYGPHILAACGEAFATFDGSASQLLAALTPTDIPCTFSAPLSNGETPFKPMCNIVSEGYNGYTILKKPAIFQPVDIVSLGDTASETAHHLRESKGFLGESEGVIYRSCEATGSLSFTFTFDDTQLDTLYLRCVYRDKGILIPDESNPDSTVSMELHGKTDRITALIGVQSLCEDESAPLIPVYYPIPRELLSQCHGKLTLQFCGSNYEGRGYPPAKLYGDIALGNFR